MADNKMDMDPSVVLLRIPADCLLLYFHLNLVCNNCTDCPSFKTPFFSFSIVKSLAHNCDESVIKYEKKDERHIFMSSISFIQQEIPLELLASLYSTVTDFARLRGLSTSSPFATDT